MRSSQVMNPRTTWCPLMVKGKPCKGWAMFTRVEGEQWICSHCGSRWDANGHQTR